MLNMETSFEMKCKFKEKKLALGIFKAQCKKKERKKRKKKVSYYSQII